MLLAVNQQIRFCTNRNGARIAYATMGSGPPLVVVPGWTSHLEYVSPAVETIFPRLARQFTVIRYDKGGTGLSQRGLGHYTLDSRLADLEAVVKACHLRRFNLWGLSEGGPIAIAYTVAHPRHVARLGLYGTYARGAEMGRRDVMEALLTTVRASWGFGSEMFTSLFMPGATAEEAAEFVKVQRMSATKEDAAALLEAIYASDVSSLLPRVKASTLVHHARGDRAVPYRNALDIAAGIPGARLITIESNQHAGPAPTFWEQIVDELSDFFLEDGQSEQPEEPEPGSALSPAMLTILFTDIAGSVALTRQLGDATAQEVLREHNSLVRRAVAEAGGREVKHTGDGIMARFPTASGAIDAALAIQEAAATIGDGSLRVRVGMNAGEPVAEDNDLFGSAVQLAARVCAHARPGEVLVTNVVRELAMGKRYLFHEQPSADLKGFDEPVRLFEVRRGI